MLKESNLSRAVTRSFEKFISVITTAALPISIVYFAVLLVLRGFIYADADGIAFGEKGVIGGDYLAFWTSAKAFVQGHALSMYDREAFEAAMSSVSGLERHFMMWQYPPTAFFIIAPLGFFDYIAGYVFWMGATFAALIFALKSIDLSWREVIILVFAPMSLLVMDTGQISFLTTALMILAVFFPGSRPILAGVAAGLLTFKPHLGVLIPLAYLAAGCWRAFAAAAVTSVVVLLSSLAVFGLDGWILFYDSVTRIYTDYMYDGGSTPPKYMTTLMSQMRLLEIDQSVAATAHYIFAAFLAFLVVIVWRMCPDIHLRAALICSAAILVTPYAYSYELVILVAPAAALVVQARSTGWLIFERPALILGWYAIACFRSWEFMDVVQVPFLVTLGCLALIVRRILVLHQLSHPDRMLVATEVRSAAAG